MNERENIARLNAKLDECRDWLQAAQDNDDDDMVEEMRDEIEAIEQAIARFTMRLEHA